MSKIIQISGSKVKREKGKQSPTVCVREQRTGQFSSAAQGKTRRETILGDAAKRFGPALKNLAKR